MSQCPHSPRVVRGFGMVGVAVVGRVMDRMVVKVRRREECIVVVVGMRVINIIIN